MSTCPYMQITRDKTLQEGAAPRDDETCVEPCTYLSRNKNKKKNQSLRVSNRVHTYKHSGEQYNCINDIVYFILPFIVSSLKNKNKTGSGQFNDSAHEMSRCIKVPTFMGFASKFLLIFLILQPQTDTLNA